MEKFNNIQKYCDSASISKQDMVWYIARASLLLATECEHNFNGDASETAKVALALQVAFDVLNNVK